MRKETLIHRSRSLDRDMRVMIYGRGGVPFLGFPTQDSPCTNYEDFGLVEQLSDYLDAGKMQLFVVDTAGGRRQRDPRRPAGAVPPLHRG